MRASVCWIPPVELLDGHAVGMVYDCYPGSLPDRPGIYVFAGNHEGMLEPIHVGRAKNIRSRIRQQFLENERLMTVIRSLQPAPRFLQIAEVNTEDELEIDLALEIVERSLVERYMTEGFRLINSQGDRIVADEIVFGGHRQGLQHCPRQIIRPRRKPRVAH